MALHIYCMHSVYMSIPILIGKAPWIILYVGMLVHTLFLGSANPPMRRVNHLACRSWISRRPVGQSCHKIHRVSCLNCSQIIRPRLGDIVDSGLSYRSASLCSRYDNPMLESTLPPCQGQRICPLYSGRRKEGSFPILATFIRTVVN
jgi:hypothetical protein